MGDTTFRVLAALRELADETEDAPETKAVATRGAVSVGVAERELTLLDTLGAAEERGGDSERFAPAGLAVSEIGQRADTLDELEEDERDALLAAMRDGDADPRVRPLGHHVRSRRGRPRARRPLE